MYTKYFTLPTSVYNLNYHLIWGTKYRNKVLKGHV
ncbi:transposase, partial [Limosilactobacillus fermentum]|nr:transposase [Limosilactobacillus fermentum]